MIGFLKLTRSDTVTPDEQSIQNINEKLESAWNAADSHGYAAPFAADANFIHIYGGQLDGRAVIDASHRVIFGTIYKGSRLAFKFRTVRFLRPEVALVFADAHLKFEAGGETREIDTRPTLVLAKEEGGWKIVAFQNTRVSEMPAAAKAAAQLAK